VTEEAPVVDEGYQPFPDISAWTVVPFDPTTYDQYAALLESARAEATEEAREYAVKTAIRYAGTDTGAIEGLYTTDRGFTRTVAIEAAHWEAAANERGPNAAQIIKDQIEAYEWLLDLVTESRPVTEHVIRELHAMLCRSQDTYVVHTEVGPQERPLPKGEYKRFPNNPTSLATGQMHHYAPPDIVAPEVHRLVESLSTSEYREAHPVIQAAYLHYSLVAIHPFADGNGRTTRALASVPLYRALRLPLLVFRDQRDEYLDTLEAADVGNLPPFVRFVEDRVADTTMLVIETTRVGPTADRARSLEALHQAAARSGDVSPSDLDAAVDRLLRWVNTEIGDQVAELNLPKSVQVTTAIVTNSPRSPSSPGHYRRPRSRETLNFQVESGPFGRAVFDAVVAPFVARSADVAPFLLTTTMPDFEALGLSLRDVIPEIRSVTKIRLSAWVSRVLDAALAQAAANVAAGSGAPPHVR
jgi:Fic family protein